MSKNRMDKTSIMNMKMNKINTMMTSQIRNNKINILIYNSYKQINKMTTKDKLLKIWKLLVSKYQWKKYKGKKNIKIYLYQDWKLLVPKYKLIKSTIHKIQRKST